MYTCIEKIRDKNGIIIKCSLLDRSSGKRQVVSKADVKAYLRQNPNGIDNLQLTSDGRLIEKNRTLENYEKACLMLGMKPLDIKFINNKYVITGLRGENQITIPKFVDSIRVDNLHSGRGVYEPPFVIDNSENLSQITTGVKYLVKSEVEALKKLGVIENKIDELSDSSSKQFNKMQMTQEEIKKHVNKSVASLNELEATLKSENVTESVRAATKELKSLLEKHGAELIKLKQDLTSDLKSVTDNITEEIKKNTGKTKEAIKYHEDAVGYISSAEKDCLSAPDKFNKVMAVYRCEFPYEVIKAFEELIKAYYPIVLSMDKLMEQIKPKTREELKEYEQKGLTKTLKRFKNNIEKRGLSDTIIDGTDKFISGTAKTIGAISSAKLFKEILNNVHIVNTTSQYYGKMCRIAHPYEIYPALEEYSNSFDRDIAVYEIEKIFAPKAIKDLDVLPYVTIPYSGKCVQSFEYRYLLKLFSDNMQAETRIHFDDEMRQRIVLAFICAKKIIKVK